MPPLATALSAPEKKKVAALQILEQGQQDFKIQPLIHQAVTEERDPAGRAGLTR